MLTLGPGSACDICLEGFGTSHKVASAIICGHAFCSECIDKLRSAPPTTNHPDPNYKPCPLCRHTFDTRTYIRLHVDHDSNARPTVRPTVSEEDAQTVRSLSERMINIANEGSSEEDSRQCITEARSFLQRQKDSKQFVELRTCFRMLVYTVDIRATNRQLQAQKAELETQKKDLEASLNQVREEKAEVERKAEYERDLALSIEKSLQDHAKLTRDGYEAMIVHYNRAATDLNTICEHLQQCRDDNDSSYHHQTTQELASRITQRLSSYHDEHVRRHVITEPGNLMVSPLAAYSALPTRPFALPEESEVEMSPPKPNFRSRSSTCCNPDHPADSSAIPCPETPQPHQRSRTATVSDHLVFSSEPRVAEPVHTDGSAPIPITQTECEAAGFHSNNDNGRVHRSTTYQKQCNCEHDNSDQPALSCEHTSGSISRPPGRESLSVDETTPPAGTTPLATTSSPQVRAFPSHISGSTSRSQRRESIPKEKMPTTTTPLLAPTSESPSTHVFRNYMLQDLLEDTIPISGSSSQISVSSTQSPVEPRDSHRSDEKKGSGLGYYTLPQPSPSLLAERRELHRQESLRKSQAHDTQNEEVFIPPLSPVCLQPIHQSYDHVHTPVPMYDPLNVPISSASNAAKAKARERAAKAESEKNKDSIRKKAEREERRKAKRAEAGYPEYERFTSSLPDESLSSSTSRRPSDSYHATDHSQQGTSSSRHTSSYDPPPPYSSASQRISSSGGKSSRYAEKYAIDSHGNKYIPVHILSATPA